MNAQEQDTALKQLDNIRDVADVISGHMKIDDKDKPLDERIHAQFTGLIAALESEKKKSIKLQQTIDRLESEIVGATV